MAKELVLEVRVPRSAHELCTVVLPTQVLCDLPHQRISALIPAVERHYPRVLKDAGSSLLMEQLFQKLLADLRTVLDPCALMSESVLSDFKTLSSVRSELLHDYATTEQPNGSLLWAPSSLPANSPDASLGPPLVFRITTLRGALADGPVTATFYTVDFYGRMVWFLPLLAQATSSSGQCAPNEPTREALLIAAAPLLHNVDHDVIAKIPGLSNQGNLPEQSVRNLLTGLLIGLRPFRHKLNQAQEVRDSADLRKVFEKYDLTEWHGVNQANLMECMKRVKQKIGKEGALTVALSGDLDLVKSAMHQDLI
jgi:hypothetical protein